ncbi:hypothetical protein [Fulvimarina endophytica]|nr:hypothetical protein [Fulvimarina endophytica]
MKKQKRPFEVVTVRRRGTKLSGGLFGGVAGFTEAMAAERPLNADTETSAPKTPVEADRFFKPMGDTAAPKARVLDDTTQILPAPASEPARKRGRPRKERTEEDKALQAAKATQRRRQRRAQVRQEEVSEMATDAVVDGDASASRPTAPDAVQEPAVAGSEPESIARGGTMAQTAAHAAFPLGKRWMRHLPRWGKLRRESGL